MELTGTEYSELWEEQDPFRVHMDASRDTLVLHFAYKNEKTCVSCTSSEYMA